MGHTTRCIPIIAYLLQKGCEVIVAGTKTTNKVLQSEFETLTYYEINGYNINYSKKEYLQHISVALQIPKILLAMRKEHYWLKNFCNKHDIDIIISDNRYGFYHKKVKSIFISHQLTIQVPRSTFLQKSINKINHYLVQKFSSCWIPDYENNCMAGALSSVNEKNNNSFFSYIGNLSRYTKNEQETNTEEIIAVLSGPEPQRTVLEQLLIQQSIAYTIPITIVRGMYTHKNTIDTSSYTWIACYNTLPSAVLQHKIQHAKIVLSRAGYSSIMDYVKINKHAILIATPGQTEQEYLASLYTAKKLCICFEQNNFDLKKAIDSYASFSYNEYEPIDTELYKKTIDTFF